MDSAYNHSKDDIMTVPKSISLTMLLKQSVEQIERGQVVEAITFLTLACKQLTLKQTAFIPMLDSLIEKCMALSQAKETLFEASKRFAKADAELLASLPMLKQLETSFSRTPHLL